MHRKLEIIINCIFLVFRVDYSLSIANNSENILNYYTIVVTHTSGICVFVAIGKQKTHNFVQN